MKYLKLIALLLLAWAVTFSGAAVLSLRAVGGAPAALAAHLWMQNDLPKFAQPGSFEYEWQGKHYTATTADLDKYQAKQAATPPIKQMSQIVGLDQGSPGAWLLYRWCSSVLPWVSLALALWLLNIAAGTKRLTDALG